MSPWALWWARFWWRWARSRPTSTRGQGGAGAAQNGAKSEEKAKKRTQIRAVVFELRNWTSCLPKSAFLYCALWSERVFICRFLFFSCCLTFKEVFSPGSPVFFFDLRVLLCHFLLWEHPFLCPVLRPSFYLFGCVFRQSFSAFWFVGWPFTFKFNGPGEKKEAPVFVYHWRTGQVIGFVVTRQRINLYPPKGRILWRISFKFSPKTSFDTLNNNLESGFELHYSSLSSTNVPMWERWEHVDENLPDFENRKLTHSSKQMAISDLLTHCCELIKALIKG